nr:Pre-mRNA-processing factor 18 (PRPF18) [Euglena gracilis]
MATWEALKQKLNERSSTLVREGPKRWRRGDVEADRVRRLMEEQEKERVEQEAKRQKRLEQLRDTKRTPKASGGCPVAASVQQTPSEIAGEPKPTDAEGLMEVDNMSALEVIRRLRVIGEPATLFGETDRDRWARLRQLQLTGNYDMLVEQGRNDFADQLRRSEEEALRRGAEEHQEPEEERREREAQALAEMEEELRRTTESLAEAVQEDFVAGCFRKCLQAWEIELQRRPPAEKMSAKGRHAYGFFSQTQSFLQPLFEALATRSLAPAILTPLVTICEYTEKREYVRANEWYMKLAIGNAAWPMGVTSVGIHERAATEAIFCGKVAHILNNETQRKYIQGVKRLLTQAQILFPTDPSKSVW